MKFELTLGNKKLLLGERTILVGILNVTPDSFSDGGLYYDDIDKAVGHAQQMLTEGADIIDIGGESSRPGAEQVSTDEELRRVITVLRPLRKHIGDRVIISIDTYKSSVAEQAIVNSADMINSLGGFTFDPKLAEIISKHKCPVVLYHIKGIPKTMQKGTILYRDVVKDITQFFQEQIDFGISKGIKREQFLIDPGIGFGKTPEQNLEIIKRLGEFQNMKLPIVIGVSRKQHLGTVLQKELGLKEIPSTLERIEGALAETAVAIQNGAHIIRTHDVLQTKKFVTILDRLCTKYS